MPEANLCDLLRYTRSAAAGYKLRKTSPKKRLCRCFNPKVYTEECSFGWRVVVPFDPHVVTHSKYSASDDHRRASTRSSLAEMTAVPA